jgi:hypothetical protein
VLLVCASTCGLEEAGIWQPTVTSGCLSRPPSPLQPSPDRALSQRQPAPIDHNPITLSGPFKATSSRDKAFCLDKDLGSKISSRVETPFLSQDETLRSIKYWQEKASSRKFDADTHIVDSFAHNSVIDHLERSKATASEFFRCAGRYDLIDNHYLDLGLQEGRGVTRISDAISKGSAERCEQQKALSSRKSESNDPHIQSQRPQEDSVCLRKSYTILCNILDTSNLLRSMSS